MSARTPIRLVADTDDNECGFVLYDPRATMGVEQGIGDWEDKRREFAGDGRAAVHVASSLQRSPDNPGTERRIAWLSLDGTIPEELVPRAWCAVSGSRLQVPSGIVHFCGAFAMRSDGPPSLEGERYDTAEIPRGDYRLDIYMAEWREGERERFVEERSRPSDRAMNHRLGTLGFLAIALSCLAPFFLAFGYLALPLISGARLPSHTWMWTVGLLGLLWLVILVLSRTPGQRRLIAAQNACDAIELPAIVYVLTRDKLGTEPAFYHEEARESVTIRRRYGLTSLRTLARGASQDSKARLYSDVDPERMATVRSNKRESHTTEHGHAALQRAIRDDQSDSSSLSPYLLGHPGRLEKADISTLVLHSAPATLEIRLS